MDSAATPSALFVSYTFTQQTRNAVKKVAAAAAAAAVTCT